MSILSFDDNKCATTFEGPEDYRYEDYQGALDEDYAPDFERLEDEDEEWEEERSPEPWEEQVRLWGMYPGE